MAIQDSDPERRNLIITSFAFITFYVADGKLVDEAVFRLQLAPIKFENIFALKVIAWSMLIWFFIRYWQTHRKALWNAYRGYVDDFSSRNNGGRKYLEAQYDFEEYDKSHKKGSFQNPSIVISNTKTNKLSVKYRLIQKVEHSPSSGYRITQQATKEKPVEGFHGWLLKIKYIVSFSAKTPGATSFLAPYLLFFAALLMPVLRYFNYV